MKGLLKADFSRVFKDKLLIVLGVLAVVFAVTLPLIYAALFHGTGATEDEAISQMLSGFISAKAQFFASFSLGNNLGLIVPVLLAIVLWKDFSYGTVRNKIIAGKSRASIFFSMFTTASAILIGVMLLHAFLTLGVSLLFFEYQAEEFTSADLWYFLESLGFEILVLLCVSALISFLCAGMKNVGLVIVLYVAFAFALVLVGSILQAVILVLGVIPEYEDLVSVLRFFDRINIGSAATYIGTGTSYTARDVLYLTLPPVFGLCGFLGLGLLCFSKKDLK